MSQDKQKSGWLERLKGFATYSYTELILACIMVATMMDMKTHAKDFGTKGHANQIIEQPFLKMIDERLQKVDIKKEQEKMTSIVKDRVNNPAPIRAIDPATTGRVFYFDPTYTLDKDVVLPCGKILHKAGTKVNPLEHMKLNRRLFFIDSRDKLQVQWLKKQLADPQTPQADLVEDRIILVGGSVFKLKESLGKLHADKVYFDQNGELTNKFGIKASPAIAQQEGLKLKIEEIKSLLGFYSPPLGAKSFGQMVILRVPPVNMAMKI